MVVAQWGEIEVLLRADRGLVQMRGVARGLEFAGRFVRADIKVLDSSIQILFPGTSMQHSEVLRTATRSRTLLIDKIHERNRISINLQCLERSSDKTP